MKTYKDIKTAKELIDQVSVHGISTKEEDICRALKLKARLFDLLDGKAA